MEELIEPCGADDDLEQFTGEEIPDPWDDEDQKDWDNQSPVVI